MSYEPPATESPDQPERRHALACLAAWTGGAIVWSVVGLAIAIPFAFIVSYVLATIIKVTIGIRVTEAQEEEGLDISIHEKLPLIDSPRGRGPILEAFAEAWERMVSFVAWLIAMLGILVPLAVLLLLGALVVRRILRGGTPPGVPQA